MSDRARSMTGLRRVAAVAALLLLAACEHGALTFDRTTGQFQLPIGGGSRAPGTNR